MTYESWKKTVFWSTKNDEFLFFKTAFTRYKERVALADRFWIMKHVSEQSLSCMKTNLATEKTRREKFPENVIWLIYDAHEKHNFKQQKGKNLKRKKILSVKKAHKWKTKE